MKNELYPFTGKFFERDGLRLHYLDEGEGDPVVMVHGNPSWSVYFRQLVGPLSKTNRVIVPDHIGCGLSDKPDDSKYRYTLDSRVADLEALLDQLGIRSNVTLVVHDWGGAIGFAWATKYPERIARLVVMNTSAFPLPKKKRVPFALRLCRNTKLGEFLVRRLNAFAVGTAMIGCKRNPMSPELRKLYVSPYDTPEHRIATIRFVQDIPLGPGDPAWATLMATEKHLVDLGNVPTLLLWGMRDFVFDEHFLNEWLLRFAGAEVHRFDDCGHYVLEDAAAEIVPLVESFMKRTARRDSPAFAGAVS